MERNRVICNCDNCGKEISKKKSEYEKSKHHFCNVDCKSQWQDKKLLVGCENCGKLVIQTFTQYNRAKHHYCSNKCQKEFQHKLNTEKRVCEICGTEFEVSKLSTQKLCSVDCQHEWQKLQIGELSPNYNRETVKCEYCNKEYTVPQHKIKSGQHLFCSVDCKRKWYSEVWSQDPDWKEKSRLRAVRLLQDGLINTNTKPQRDVNSILDNLNIPYINEGSFIYYSVDNYLPNHNLIIEVMGDYWHGNPLKFSFNSNDIQTKRIQKDRAKHTYIKKYYDIEILYLWESDINNNPDLCEKIIKEYIDNHGVLNNYQSFNYRIENNELKLNTDLIKAYFEQ